MCLIYCTALNPFTGIGGGATRQACRPLEQRRGREGGRSAGREEFGENVNI